MRVKTQHGRPSRSICSSRAASGNCPWDTRRSRAKPTSITNSDAGAGRGQFDLDKGRRRFGLNTALPPAAKGRVMNSVLAGEIGGGQSAAIKRGQKFVCAGRHRCEVRGDALKHYFSSWPCFYHDPLHD